MRLHIPIFLLILKYSILRQFVPTKKRVLRKSAYLFAFDPTIPEYYGRLGWRTIGMDEFKSHPVTVMEVAL